MFTRKSLIKYIDSFLKDLKTAGYSPIKVVFFGSYASGTPNENSDIDLAVWDKRFVGLGMIDIEPILSIVSKYPAIELHPFSEGETEDDNPFISEVLKLGIVVYNHPVQIPAA
jgi:predicted nucleotidyltransferase